jgi:urea-proton symporter
MSSDLLNITNKNNVLPPFLEYSGQTSYFGGAPPLPLGVGYAVVLGFGAFFTIVTTILVYMNKYFGKMGEITSEYFK